MTTMLYRHVMKIERAAQFRATRRRLWNTWTKLGGLPSVTS